MVTKLNKNVLLIKNVPSNLIEEVVVILKTEEKNIKNKTKEILMLEAKEIINDCTLKLQNEYEIERKKEREIENKRKRQKANVVALGGFLLFTISIILLVNILR